MRSWGRCVLPAFFAWSLDLQAQAQAQGQDLVVQHGTIPWGPPTKPTGAVPCFMMDVTHTPLLRPIPHPSTGTRAISDKGKGRWESPSVSLKMASCSGMVIRTLTWHRGQLRQHFAPPPSSPLPCSLRTTIIPAKHSPMLGLLKHPDLRSGSVSRHLWHLGHRLHVAQVTQATTVLERGSTHTHTHTQTCLSHHHISPSPTLHKSLCFPPHQVEWNASASDKLGLPGPCSSQAETIPENLPVINLCCSRKISS